MVDISGRIVKTVQLAKDVLQTRLHVKDLAAGSYRLVWNDGGRRESKVVLIKH